MAESILNVENLHVAFGEREVVGGIDLSIQHGECLALVGESGSGKSVSAHAILGLLPRQARVSGHIGFDGLNLVAAGPGILQTIRGNRIAMVFQEPMTSLNPLHTVGRQIGESLLLHRRLGRTARREKVLALLADVGIPEPEIRIDQYPHQLSGGQRQRVMIAMALACEPELVIADEPTTALDVVVQARIIDLLNEIRQKRRMSLLIISHDLNVVRRIADRVAVMKQGEIVETGDTRAVFAHPQHPYTQMLIAAEPEGRAAQADASAPVILRAGPLNVDYTRRGFLFARPRVFHALKDFSMTLRAGHTLGVVGESGSGKSTLGQAILRLIPSRGLIDFEGAELSVLKPAAMRAWRKHLQIVFQDPFGSLSPFMTVEEIIGEGLREHSSLASIAIEQAVIEALRDVQLDPEVRHRFAHEFSGGQRQRIAIARALVLRPRVIVLDEPTSALDRSVQKQVIGLLRDLQGRFGIAYIFISHDLAVVRAIAHDVVVLRSGRIEEQGAAQEVLAHPQSDYTQALMGASSLAVAPDGFWQEVKECIEAGAARSTNPKFVV